MYERSDQNVEKYASAEVRKEIERGFQRSGALNFLKVKRGKELNAVHDAVRECHHNTGRCEGNIPPDFVGYEDNLVGALTIVHPCWESE